MFILERCKREDYIKAWNAMYLNDKKIWNTEMFDGVNPSLNKKPLGTETDNFCVVVYDSDKLNESGFEDFKYGMPIGIFSFVVTPRKIIGKQFVVNPNYQGHGIGKALLIENEKTLKDNGFDKYYIGCSKYSAGILKKYWGIEPFSSDVEGDLFKFNVDLNRENFDKLYSDIIENNSNIKVINSCISEKECNSDTTIFNKIEETKTEEDIKNLHSVEKLECTIHGNDHQLLDKLKDNLCKTNDIKPEIQLESSKNEIAATFCNNTLEKSKENINNKNNKNFLKKSSQNSKKRNKKKNKRK